MTKKRNSRTKDIHSHDFPFLENLSQENFHVLFSPHITPHFYRLTFLFFPTVGIPVLFKNTTMCMHHKFCLIDTRSQTEKETKDGQKRIDDQNDVKKKAKKKAKIEKELASDDEESEKEDQDSEKPRKKKRYIPENGICITGSCNWTMQGFSSNWENIIVTNNNIIVSRFRQEFDRIWSDFISAQRVKEPVIRNDLAGWHE